MGVEENGGTLQGCSDPSNRSHGEEFRGKGQDTHSCKLWAKLHGFEHC